MAIQHIETLDDPVQSTGSLQWAGQVSGTKPNRIQDDEAAELINVDLTPDGMLCPRPACRRWGVMTYRELAGGMPSAYSPQCYLKYIELPGLKLLFAIGDDRQEQTYTAGKLWVYTEAKTCLTASAVSDWDCVEVWTRTLDPSQVLQRATYISFAQLINVVYVSGNQPYIKAITITPDGTPVLTYSDIHTFDDGTTLLPNVSYVAEHRGRIFAVQKDSDIIWPSSILGVTATGGALVSFKITDGIRVGKGEGDPIVALVPGRDNELLVFCKHSVWSVDANPLQTTDQWTITAITRQVGIVGPDAWTWVGNDVWFYSPIGITSVRRVIAGDDQEISPILSYPVQDIIDTVNTAYVHNIRAATVGNRVIFAIPLDLEHTPMNALVYNMDTAHWGGLWKGPFWSLEVCRFGGVNRLFSTERDFKSRGIYEWNPDSTDDDYGFYDYDWSFTPGGTPYGEVTAPVESTVRTKSYNWGDFKQLKSPESMEVECWEGAGEMDVMVQLDGQDESTLYPFLTVAEDVSLDVLPRFPLRFPIRFEWNNSVRRGWDLLMRPGMRECREMAVVLKLRGRWRLREIMVNAYINTYEIEI